MEKNLYKQTELTFQLIVESSPSAIVLVNKEGKVAYINSQTEKLFGYARAELIGQPVELLIPVRFQENHPNFRDTFFRSPVVRSMGGGRELFAIRKDKSEFPIEIGLNPLVTVDGTLVLASIIDISERIKAQERFRLVVESAPNAMILVDSAGIINLVNHQTEKLFGYHRSELNGQQMEFLIPMRFRIQHPQQRKVFFENPKVRAMGAGRDLFALRKDGTEVQVEIGLNPIETIDGQMVLASIIDITERKIQERSQKKQVELEIKNRDLEQFAYLASHDLQEPLRTVSNYMSLFAEDYGDLLDDNAKKYLSSVNKAISRMSLLIKSLLDFSRLGRNTKMAKVNCRKILSEVVADLEIRIKTSQASVVVDQMPEVLGYETELRQLFQNLITNAIKFQRPDHKPEIKISASVLDKKWTFAVKDNGIGIAREHFERIFGIFQRLHTKEEFEGNGIGLANCKKIVELHNGEIWLESSVGVGSTFYFSINLQ